MCQLCESKVIQIMHTGEKLSTPGRVQSACHDELMVYDSLQLAVR